VHVRDGWMEYVVLSDPIGQPLAPWSVSADWAPTGAVGESFLLGSRRGPVNDRETTGNSPVAWDENALLTRHIGGSSQVRKRGPRNLARVGVAGSSPVSAPNPCLNLQKRVPGSRVRSLRSCHTNENTNEIRAEAVFAATSAVAADDQSGWSRARD
jgi:hypothetical protein